MKRTLSALLALALVICAAPAATAGDFYEIWIAAEGRGADLYTAPRGGIAGLLYNGYVDDDVNYEREQNGWFPLSFTDDYTVWVYEKTASACLPDTTDSREWNSLMPCSAFLGQVIEDNAVMRSKPDKRSRLIARHAAGSQFIVWGEFGAYYLVESGHHDFGFISQSSIVRMNDLFFEEALYWYSKTPDPSQMRGIYCEAGGVAASDSAAGISDRVANVYRNGREAGIQAWLPNGWVQLADGSFLDSRYLDPDADHSPARTAVIKPSTVLNRLKVRYAASTDDFVVAKLCAGVEVEVISETDDWAVVSIIGASTVDGSGKGITSVHGCVQKKYLAPADDAKVPDGTVTVAVLADLTDSSGRIQARQGETVTVIGTDYVSYRGVDRLLIRCEDGRLFWLEQKDDVLDPVAYPNVSVRTSAKAALRAAPNTDAEILTTLHSGRQVKVLLRGEQWTMVSYQEQKGYVESRYLKFP